jgi:hypothetical protein
MLEIGLVVASNHKVLVKVELVQVDVSVGLQPWDRISELMPMRQ